jgi:hypothetical protein
MKNTKKTDIVKEAIAEAKLVQKSAVEIAQQKLHEKYMPQIQRMVSMKLENEMEDEEFDGAEDDAIENEVDAVDAPEVDSTDEMGDELELDGEDVVENDEVEIPGQEDEMGSEDDEMDMELESILRELEGEDEEVADDDADMNLDFDTDEAPADADAVEGGDDFDLDEIIREIEGMEDSEEEAEESYSDEEVEELKIELRETRKAYDILKKQLQEINLLNNKLLYVNKLFNDFTLTKEQKEKVISKIDLSENVREVKLTYSTLVEGLRFARVSRKKVFEANTVKPIKKTETKILKESSDDALKAKFQRLAGITKK